MELTSLGPILLWLLAVLVTGYCGGGICAEIPKVEGWGFPIFGIIGALTGSIIGALFFSSNLAPWIGMGVGAVTPPLLLGCLIARQLGPIIIPVVVLVIGYYVWQWSLQPQNEVLAPMTFSCLLAIGVLTWIIYKVVEG